MKYWKQGFYEEPLSDSTEITDQYWQELLEGQSCGLTIQDQDGYPVLVAVEPSQQELNLERITHLKELLTHSDYMAMKVADNAMTPEEYEPVKKQRAQWRAEINELENI